jgi:hypothetical protein
MNLWSNISITPSAKALSESLIADRHINWMVHR